MKKNKMKQDDPFPPQQEAMQTDIFANRVSIAEMRKIWNDRNRHYTDEELFRIREWLYVIAETIVKVVDNTPAEVLQDAAQRRKNKTRNSKRLYDTDDEVNAA